MLDRRHFLSTAATGVAASLVFRGSPLAQLEKTPPLPDHSLFDKNEDAMLLFARECSKRGMVQVPEK